MQTRIACAYTELVPLGQLKPYGRNRHKHPKAQIERLASLIEVHGQRRPLIVWKETGEVVAGNGTLEALKLLGSEAAAVDYQSFSSPDAAYFFSVSDNAISKWAELDLAGINADLPDLHGFGLEDLGIEKFDFDMPGLDEEKPEKEKTPKACPHCGGEL